MTAPPARATSLPAPLLPWSSSSSLGVVRPTFSAAVSASTLLAPGGVELLPRPVFKEERRRLVQRVGWLRDLVQLLPPALASSTVPEKENGSDTAAAAVRTVLTRRLEAMVREADRLLAAGSSCATQCCCWRFFRCYAQARRLERAGAGVDEVYAQVLPVVSQIDATQRVVHMLAALHQRTSSSQHRRHDGAQHPFGHNRSDTQPAAARPDGNEDLDRQPNPEHVDAQAATGDTNEFRSGEGTARMTGP
ncbi:hypothetical protein C2845_PM13G04840 [Panicum miliaceum]|uniref:Uncharacterized protein n=1 Tax=Panicum miliaceum TaxID=4540 RepID=A0A3L6RL42_PANMI|nr:hypothetical protein C2845_PM13G04840 [Panicum miliaceum]